MFGECVCVRNYYSNINIVCYSLSVLSYWSMNYNHQIIICSDGVMYYYNKCIYLVIKQLQTLLLFGSKTKSIEKRLS